MEIQFCAKPVLYWLHCAKAQGLWFTADDTELDLRINMTSIFNLPDYDSEFARRNTPAEWQRISAFRNQPQFGQALKTYHALMPQFFSSNLLLNKIVKEAWRFEMLVYTLYLYDSRDPTDSSSGLTLSNLQRVCTAQNCASNGRVFAILSLMRGGGFLVQHRSTDDHRIKHMEPTKKFVTLVEGWNHRIFKIIDAVVPAGQLAKAHDVSPRFGWDMRKRGAEALLTGWKLLDPFPEVTHFVSSDGGWMLLLHCVALALQDGAIIPVSVDLESFGKRFAVSRSHLRRLLESAYTEGLLDAPPHNGSDIKLSARTVAAFLNCMASELSFYQNHATT